MNAHQHEWIEFKVGRNKRMIACRHCCISREAYEYMQKVGKDKK